MKRKYFLFTVLMLLGCSNTNNSSILSNTSSTVNNTSSTSSSKNDEKLTKEFVVNKLNDTINKSYTLSYSYEGISYDDTYVPNSYYYNGMNNVGVLLANLYGDETYAYDYNINNNKVEITNQAYGINGLQGQTSLSYASLGLNDYSNLLDCLEVTEDGIKLEESNYIKMLTYAINDANDFHYIIFNKVDDNLTFDFYYDNQLYDGYSYILKDIGSASNLIVDNYLKEMVKYTNNGVASKDTFNSSKINISGSIKYIGMMGNKTLEEISNTRIINSEVTNYELSSTSNDISYKQYFMEDSENKIYKVGLNGANLPINSLTELSSEELFPSKLFFLEDTFLIDGFSETYAYFGSNSNRVISYLLPNMSSIVLDAWVTQIQFIISNNKITKFSFVTDFYSYDNNYGYFIGEFSISNDGEISITNQIEKDGEEDKINLLLNKLKENNANYTIESNTFSIENNNLIPTNEKHIINYIDDVYFDGNYRINSDGSLVMQFANGYIMYNEKVYSFRYDASIKKVDNVKETSYTSIGEAILSLKAEVLDFELDNTLIINKNVTEIKDNVGMLEQTGLIDPSSLKFILNEDLDSIEKITYLYGNAYTSAYVEANITYGEAFIDESIIEDLIDKIPNDIDIEELYLKDFDDVAVLEIYEYLRDEYLGDKANYVPYISGIENCVEIIWLGDYPEGYQYLINDAPSDYLDKFKEALVVVYGYTQVNENEYINEETGLKIQISKDMDYQQIYIISI